MTHYIVVSEKEIVKAEMPLPLCWDKFQPNQKHPDIGLTKNGYYQCASFQAHCLSLPRIPIEGKHKWELWQEVPESEVNLKPVRTWTERDGEYGCAECCNRDRCDEDCDATYYRPNCPYCKGKGWFKEIPVIAIPIQPTPEPIVKGKEKCTCNEFTKIADCKKDCDITPQGKAKYDEAFEWFRSLTINQRQHIRWLYGNPHDGYMSREKTIEVYERRDTEYAKNIIIKTTTKANKQPTPEGEKEKCNGNCGMSYCDEYGCIENKPKGDVSHLLTPLEELKLDSNTIRLIERLKELQPYHINPYNLGDEGEVSAIIDKLANLLTNDNTHEKI